MVGLGQPQAKKCRPGEGGVEVSRVQIGHSSTPGSRGPCTGADEFIRLATGRPVSRFARRSNPAAA